MVIFPSKSDREIITIDVNKSRLANSVRECICLLIHQVLYCNNACLFTMGFPTVICGVATIAIPDSSVSPSTVLVLVPPRCDNTSKPTQPAAKPHTVTLNDSKEWRKKKSM